MTKETTVKMTEAEQTLFDARMLAITDIVERADAFAEYHHAAISQKRKYTGDDYIVHPRAVMHIVKSVPHTIAQLCAALLHDTVEDTHATLDEIERAFGSEISILVEMLTDISKKEDGNRKFRKAMDLDHTAKASDQAKTIKLADLIHNSVSIMKYDPRFAKVFITEKTLMMKVLIGGDHTLYKRAMAVIDRYHKDN